MGSDVTSNLLTMADGSIPYMGLHPIWVSRNPLDNGCRHCVDEVPTCSRQVYWPPCAASLDLCGAIQASNSQGICGTSANSEGYGPTYKLEMRLYRSTVSSQNSGWIRRSQRAYVHRWLPKVQPLETNIFSKKEIRPFGALTTSFESD